MDIVSFKRGNGQIDSHYIDFATIKDQANDMPVAQTNFTVTSLNISVGLIRVGNLVIAESYPTVSSFSPVRQLPVGVNIPGFTPIHGVNLIWVGIAGSNSTMGLHKTVDGGWEFSTPGISGNTILAATAVWITNDDWPA